MKLTVLSLVAAYTLFGQGLPQFKALRPEVVPASITVAGTGGTTAMLTEMDLAKLPQQTVKTTDHGTAVTFEGVLLNDVLAKVALPAGEASKSKAASYYVLAEAQDRYKAVFSWAEIDPTFTDRKVYVVTRREGKPLAEKDGPFELIVPGEKKYSRWVRQLKALTLREAN